MLSSMFLHCAWYRSLHLPSASHSIIFSGVFVLWCTFFDVQVRRKTASESDVGGCDADLAAMMCSFQKREACEMCSG